MEIKTLDNLLQQIELLDSQFKGIDLNIDLDKKAIFVSARYTSGKGRLIEKVASISSPTGTLPLSEKVADCVESLLKTVLQDE